MDCKAFHGRVEEILENAQGTLSQSLRFHLLSEDERSLDVFGCHYEVVERVVEILRLGLLIEMGPGGAVSSWARAIWQPWVLDVGIMGWGAGGKHLDDVVPPSLEWMVDMVGERLGCRVSAEVRDDDDGPYALAQKWAHVFRIEVEKPSLHEVMEALARVKEMLEDASNRS